MIQQGQMNLIVGTDELAWRFIEREIKGVVSDNEDDWILSIQQGQMNL